MTQPPRETRRPRDPFKAAEDLFRKSPPPLPDDAPKAAAAPGVKESVTLRIDSDVLAHFQDDGPGWQDRINAALRKAAGK
jgi:uncharacterized protein (DUF4415 family)